MLKMGQLCSLSLMEIYRQSKEAHVVFMQDSEGMYVLVVISEVISFLLYKVLPSVD